MLGPTVSRLRGGVGRCLRRAFAEVDRGYLREAGRGASGPNLSGACAAAVVVTTDRLYVAHVGDCRVVLVRLQVFVGLDTWNFCVGESPKIDGHTKRFSLLPVSSGSDGQYRGCALTVDHTPEDVMEYEAIRRRSSDPMPVRRVEPGFKQPKFFFERQVNAWRKASGDLHSCSPPHPLACSPMGSHTTRR